MPPESAGTDASPQATDQLITGQCYGMGEGSSEGSPINMEDYYRIYYTPIGADPVRGGHIIPANTMSEPGTIAELNLTLEVETNVVDRALEEISEAMDELERAVSDSPATAPIQDEDISFRERQKRLMNQAGYYMWSQPAGQASLYPVDYITPDSSVDGSDVVNERNDRGYHEQYRAMRESLETGQPIRAPRMSGLEYLREQQQYRERVDEAVRDGFITRRQSSLPPHPTPPPLPPGYKSWAEVYKRMISSAPDTTKFCYPKPRTSLDMVHVENIELTAGQVKQLAFDQMLATHDTQFNRRELSSLSAILSNNRLIGVSELREKLSRLKGIADGVF